MWSIAVSKWCDMLRRRNTGEHTAATVSLQLNDDLQEIALKAGLSTTSRIQKATTSTMKDGRIIYSNDIYIITFKHLDRTEINPEHINHIQYTGKIYCLNVPYHTLYIRRNGRTCWNGNTPAAAFCQIMPDGRFRVLHELYEMDCGAKAFIHFVLKPFLINNYRGCDIIICGDPSGIRRADSDERTCFMELKSAGLPAIPCQTNSFLARHSSLDSFLSMMIAGKPAFQVDPLCTKIRAGLSGKYYFKRIKGGDGRASDVPVKTDWSHICEAVQYAALMAQTGLHTIAQRWGENRYGNAEEYSYNNYNTSNNKQVSLAFG